MADCPKFWKSTKIQINVLNMGEEDYMDNIEISAYIAAVLDILVGIGSFLIVWNYSKMRLVYNKSEDNLGPCSGPWPLFGPWSLFGRSVGPFKLFPGFGKLKFVCFKIILAFGVPALDTIMGKEKL